MKQTALLLAALTSSWAYAQEKALSEALIPTEVRPFVEPGTRAIALCSADLNGDGYADYILVLEKTESEARESDWEQGQRPLLLIIREPSQKLSLAKRNEKILLCSTCGGDEGDPLESIEVGFEAFSVRHRGWDGSNTYRFEYSHRDDTWQLVKSERVKLHARQPHRTPEQAIYTAPRHFSEVDIGNFDPDAYLIAEPR